jgi:CRISPR-associated protein Cas1
MALSAEDVADHAEAIAATYRRPDSAGVAVVDGFGCKVTVERGALVLHDGIGQHRRTRRYERATHGLRRVVLANPAGLVTFEALRWCSSLGIGVVVLDNDGGAMLASTPRATDDARLRRVQALAPERPYGLDIARLLLGAKVAGQAKLLSENFCDPEAETGLEPATFSVEHLADAIGAAESVDEARQLEASAANIYFGAWMGEVAPRFAAKDRPRIPPHWLTYEGRRSVLASASANRKAERPVNAMLNYAFALLEAEAVFACQAVGLDPGLGIVHLDAKGRQSMALDLMEPVRPQVEGIVLAMLDERTFRKADFSEDAEGHVRVRAPLTHELAELMPLMARWLAPWAERVAHVLGDAMAGKFTPHTPLTSARLKAAQAVVKARKAEAVSRSGRAAPKQRPPAPEPLPLWRCPDCAGPVTDPRRVLCDACAAAKGHTPAVRQSRGRAIAARKALLKASAEGLGFPADKDWYRRHILPRLASHKLSELMECGISKGYASYIRSGQYVPHVSTWPALARLVGLELPEAAAHEALEVVAR